MQKQPELKNKINFLTKIWITTPIVFLVGFFLSGIIAEWFVNYQDGGLELVHSLVNSFERDLPAAGFATVYAYLGIILTACWATKSSKLKRFLLLVPFLIPWIALIVDIFYRQRSLSVEVAEPSALWFIFQDISMYSTLIGWLSIYLWILLAIVICIMQIRIRAKKYLLKL